APVDAARAERKCRVCRWSSGRRPKTKPITASSCYATPSQRSAKAGGDMTHIANVAVPAIHRLDALRIVGIRSRPASDTRPDRPDRLPRSRTTSWGGLKQPDKQEVSNVVRTHSLADAHLIRIPERCLMFERSLVISQQS